MATLEDSITEITQAIFTTVLGLDAVPADGDDGVAAAGDGGGTLAGTVRISGAFEGAVTVTCSAALANHAAAILFDVPDGATTPTDSLDALSELVNITGGNLKPLMPGPSHLSLPTVGGSAPPDCAAGSRLLGKVRFACLGQPFEVALLAGPPG